MIKYRLQASKEFQLIGRPIEEAFVFLNVTDPAEDAEIFYDGPSQLIKEIKFNLIGSYGERGRIIGEHATGYDLNSAMSQWIMAPFSPELVEGLSLLRGE